MDKNYNFCSVCSRVRDKKHLNHKTIDISNEHNTLDESFFWVYYYCNDSAHCYKMIRKIIEKDKKKVVH